MSAAMLGPKPDVMFRMALKTGAFGFAQLAENPSTHDHAYASAKNEKMADT
jgi:hypothetical protein